MATHKAILQRYLQRERDAVLSKLEGLAERDARWPQTRTGTNLLGLVKHLGTMEFGYLGTAFGRTPEPTPWIGPGAEVNDDMWATADQSIGWVTDFYRRSWVFGDATVEPLELDAPAHVPWWRPEGRDTTLQHILVHLIAETARHAGHADILRERLDGVAGLRKRGDNLPDVDEQWWSEYVAKLQALASSFGTQA